MIDVIVVGASLGGLEALELLLPALPQLPLPPIVIVQHRGVSEHSHLLHLLQVHSRWPVREPDDKDALNAGVVYVAPADYHLLIEDGWAALSTDPPVAYARPSIDVLFESAAHCFGARVIAVVLSSSSEDGVAGAIEVRRRGGRVIVQDPLTAVSPILPRAVLERAGADQVLPVEAMPVWLAATCCLDAAARQE
jgi:two-component system, chemotaxis family, protein-glutamate methylesterase/glutaminase